MLLLIYLQNVDNISSDTTESISSYMHCILSILLPSSLFKSDQLFSNFLNNKLDPPLFNLEKTYEKLVNEFL